MHTAELLKNLGYSDSANFLPLTKLGGDPDHAHIFRRAVRLCSLQGVYVLRDEPSAARGAATTPIVYVAEAASDSQADEIHRHVWNQNVVPFLIVRTPTGVRLYDGFRYAPPPRRAAPGQQAGVLEAAIRFNEVTEKLADFRASAIDDGSLWKGRGAKLDPGTRVDWKLLGNLEALGQWLHSQRLDQRIAHALIGKFVYLRYLRDRDILSDAKLEEWNMDSATVFSRAATPAALKRLVDHVDEWLNGSIFPLEFSGASAPSLDHFRQVAAVFLGDEVQTGQLHLNFRAYDFSFIPIETLSVIYEQFLAIEGANRDAGAYYTPIPLVNFMLAELQDQRPLKPGMRILDPSCGSGAFLVQCYRRLVEQHIRSNKHQRPRPSALRELLVNNIYGVDRDLDACRVAELSLVLTMLDYIEPPDLRSTPTFKLPNLHNHNIFEGDFFDNTSRWLKVVGKGFDWIVGNPPWVELNPRALDERDRVAWDWIVTHASECPVSGNQVAEAFAWKAPMHLASSGTIAFLLPAMTLFKDKGTFRGRFFGEHDVSSVANFSNMREVLFARRARLPAAAFFYGPRRRRLDERAEILVFSPFVANQEANRPPKSGERRDTWTITLDASEIRSVSSSAVTGGDSLPWKIAMWGAPRDQRLLSALPQRFPTLKEYATERNWALHEGPQLREREGATEALDPLTEVVGKNELATDRLRKLGRIYHFPTSALTPVPEERAFLRKRGGKRSLAVCRPPHVIVGATRNFAVYSEEFLVVPPRQIGIAGPASDSLRLKALSLFLNSDFAAYHQFFASPQSGVRGGLSTLDALKDLPTPIASLDESTLKRWSDLHAKLVAASLRMVAERGHTASPLFDEGPRTEVGQTIEVLERELNTLVGKALGLAETEVYLVEDLVRVRMCLIDGQIGLPAIRRPHTNEMETYAEVLAGELDAFMAPDLDVVHRVQVVFDEVSGMVEVQPLKSKKKARSIVLAATEATTGEFARMRMRVRRERGQWLYFDRNLFLCRGDQTYIFKPMQRLWWTRTQALLDADEIIARALAGSDT